MGVNVREYERWKKRLFDEKAAAEFSIPAVVLRVKRQIIRNVVGFILSNSPVLTGRFVASWRASRNVPNPNPAPKGFYARPRADKFAPVIDNISLRDVFYFTNGIHYAGALAFGSSRKAPSGWVDRSIHAAVTALHNARV